jgi:hypothetical protein
MKRLLIAALALCAPLATFAGSYSYSTTGLEDLTHGTAYTWDAVTGGSASALDKAIHGGAKLSSVTITITGLYDWTAENLDVLYVDLLNGVQGGVNSSTYNGSLTDGIDKVKGSDPFINTVGGTGYAASGSATGFTYSSVYEAGNFTDLDGPTTTNTLVLTITGPELTTLDGYLSNDYTTGADLGLGLGPDCHFDDTGVSICFNTPDNSLTVTMLGASLVGLAAFGRRKKNALIG